MHTQTHSHTHMIMHTNTHKIGRKGGGALWIKGWTVNNTLSVIEWKWLSVIQARELDPRATIEQWWLMRMTVPSSTTIGQPHTVDGICSSLLFSRRLYRMFFCIKVLMTTSFFVLFLYKVKFNVFSQYVRVQTSVWMPLGLMLNQSSPRSRGLSTGVTWGGHLSNGFVLDVILFDN